MITSKIFRILEIEETRDENLIRDAYRTKLISVNPEDDQEGFVQLREAYEQALRLSKEEVAKEQAADTPLGEWQGHIDFIYTHFHQRIDVSCWGDLFGHSYFQGFDTEWDAKKSLIAYLMDHFYLPMPVWQLIDDKCQIETNINEYTEAFPRGFLSFVIDSKKNGITLPLESFVGVPDADYDTYIRTYFSLRKLLSTDEFSRAGELINELENADVAHPYLFAERMRYAIKMNDFSSAQKWIDICINDITLLPDNYIYYIISTTYWAMSAYDSARLYALKILETSPDYWGARKILCDYDSQKMDFEKAHEGYTDLLDINPFDTEVSDSFRKNLVGLIALREQRFSLRPTEKERIELCWNYYQMSDYQKSLDSLLEASPETEDDRYSYTNLIGRLYVLLERFDEAYPFLLKWKEYIDAATDSSVESKKRQNRSGTVRFMLAQVWSHRALSSREDSDFSKATDYYDEAILLERPPLSLHYRQCKASFLLNVGRNEDCIDYCTQQLEENAGFVPFLLLRQQASFQLKLAYDVIKDFHTIISITPDISAPYVLAAEVYYRSGQHQDALQIIEQAQQQNILTPKLRLISITIRRLGAGDTGATNSCLNDLYTLSRDCETMNAADCDIKDLADIRLQICYAYMDLCNFKKAKNHVDRLILDDPDNDIYVRVLSDIYRQSDLLFESEVTLSLFLRKNPESIPVLIALAQSYARSNKFDLCIEICDKIRALAPTHTFPNQMMNKVYLKRNALCANAKYLAKALEAANDQIAISASPESILQRGLTYLDMGDLENAIEDFRAVTVSNSDLVNASYGYLGDAYKVQRDFERALENYKHSYDLYGDTYNYHACKDLAVCYESMHRYDEALAMLEQIIKNQPKIIETYDQQARIYIKCKNYQKAMDAYKLSLQQATTPYLQANAYRNMFLCNLLMNDRPSAVAIMKKPEFDRLSSVLYSKTCSDYYWLVKKSPRKAILHATRGYNLSKNGIDTWDAEKSFSVSFLEIYYEKKKRIQQATHCTQFIQAMHAKFGDTDAFINDPNARKQRCFLVGRVLYYAGGTEEARKMFLQMESGKNCIQCSYNKCVESIVARALLFECEGRYIEAAACYQEVIDEGFECHRYIPYLQNLKKKAKIKE